MSNRGISAQMAELHDNVVPFQAPITRPENSSYNPDDWLTPMETGTTFVSKENKGWTSRLDEYTVICKGDTKISLLRDNRRSIETNSVICYWEDNEDFCRRNKLIEVLWIIVS